jgi:hypothetical protein
MQVLYDIVVEHDDTPLADRARGQFRPVRCAELADHHDVQWCLQRRRHLVRDRDAPTWKPHHDGVLVAQVCQALSQLRAGRPTIGESHGDLPTAAAEMHA